jgi:hypothetical protein
MTFRKPVTITRYAAGSYVNGTYVSGTSSTLNIQASIQPMKSEEMVTETQGRRLSDFIKIYTDTNINTAKESIGQQPDELTWRGSVYECMSVDVHQMDVIPHYKCVFVKKGT